MLVQQVRNNRFLEKCSFGWWRTLVFEKNVRSAGDEHLFLRNQHRLLMWDFKIARADAPTSYPFNWNEASMRITSSLKSWSTLRRCSTCEQL